MRSTIAFLDGHFLLESDTARRLYAEVAAEQPIYDYHCHLDPADIAANRVYQNLTEIWLDGDHYKWRAMRANGVDEAYITGEADPYDKFLAWARTVPYTLRNPLYHWTHLELRRYFDIDLLLNEGTAQEVWDEANRKLVDLSTHAILDKFKVAVVCTSDDPADSLAHHKAIAASRLATKVYPTYRPDKARAISDAASYRAYVDRLLVANGVSGRRFEDVLEALAKAHQRFAAAGGRLSDHGLAALPDLECPFTMAESMYDGTLDSKAHGGATHEPRFSAFMMDYFAGLDAEAGWAMQLHLGPIRNVNQGLHQRIGADIGCDSIGDARQGAGLARLMGNLSAQQKLPKTVLYNINPADNYLFAAMAGNFQGGTPGKIQYGSGWWFLDQKDGMTWQLNALSNLGLLSRFVGMLTDSRSMMSYPRHEYFRRILCDLIGGEAERGELPDDFELLSRLVSGVCFGNAKEYFGLELDPRYEASGD